MAITLTYEWPVSGATAPTANATPPNIPTSTTKFNEVIVSAIGDGTATSFTITHNFGLTPAELAALFPEVRYEPSVAGAPSYYVSARATNSVTVGLNGTFVGTFGVFRVNRPMRTTL